MEDVFGEAAKLTNVNFNLVKFVKFVEPIVEFP